MTATTSSRRAISTVSPRIARSSSSAKRLARLGNPYPHRDHLLYIEVYRSYFFALSAEESVESAATKASCGTSTRPMVFIRFLPSFCFSSSLRLRVMSPP